MSGASTPAKDSAGQSPDQGSRILNVVSAAGAIIVVSLGMAFVFILGLVALGTVPGSQKAAVITAAFTVLGTIVGAYFGVKVGSAGRAEAEAARNAEAVKVQELAATVDPKTAQDALDRAAERLQGPGGAVAGVPRAGV